MRSGTLDALGLRGPAPKSARGKRRVDLTLTDKKNIKRIEVELDAFEWGVDRSDRDLIITLGSITLPIPTSLPRHL